MEIVDLFGEGIEELDYLELEREDDISESKEIEEDIISEGQLDLFPTGQLRLFGKGLSSANVCKLSHILKSQ